MKISDCIHSKVSLDTLFQGLYVNVIQTYHPLCFGLNHDFYITRSEHTERVKSCSSLCPHKDFDLKGDEFKSVKISEELQKIVKLIILLDALGPSVFKGLFQQK